jgi:GTP-binding protein
MHIKEVEFVGSFPNHRNCPESGKPEFAFIGRSNVGKSSLINMLCNKKGMAKVSVTPGKTQLLNFFEINHQWFLVDLPGYGYARLSKQKKETFSSMIRSYLTQRETLVLAFVLIDVRHELQKIDREFLQWCGQQQVPISLVFTKADKLGKSQLQSNIAAIRKALLADWETLPPSFVTSAETREGRDELLVSIQEVLDGVVNSTESKQ